MFYKEWKKMREELDGKHIYIEYHNDIILDGLLNGETNMIEYVHSTGMCEYERVNYPIIRIVRVVA